MNGISAEPKQRGRPTFLLARMGRFGPRTAETSFQAVRLLVSSAMLRISPSFVCVCRSRACIDIECKSATIQLISYNIVVPSLPTTNSQHSEDEEGIEIIERESPPGGNTYIDLIPPLKKRGVLGQRWKCVLSLCVQNGRNCDSLFAG